MLYNYNYICFINLKIVYKYAIEPCKDWFTFLVQQLITWKYVTSLRLLWSFQFKLFIFNPFVDFCIYQAVEYLNIFIEFNNAWKTG